MPVYEYTCRACEKRFSLEMSFAEHDKKRVKCPKCGTTRVRQSVTPFFAQTSKKS